MKKRKPIKNLEEAITEIKRLSDDFQSRNGKNAFRIPNKGFNLWMVNWMIKQDGRIANIEIRQRNTLAIVLGLMPLWIYLLTLAI